MGFEAGDSFAQEALQLGATLLEEALFTCLLSFSFLLGLEEAFEDAFAGFVGDAFEDAVDLDAGELLVELLEDHASFTDEAHGFGTDEFLEDSADGFGAGM